MAERQTTYIGSGQLSGQTTIVSVRAVPAKMIATRKKMKCGD